MRYRREDQNGDYAFGKGDNTFLINSPECVAQAIKTRLQLWYGQWFLDTTEGTPWLQSLTGKQNSAAMELVLRQRILATEGVKSILAFSSTFISSSRQAVFTVTVETLYGTATITSEA
ncbi:hypothetical protein ACMGGR_04545 [Erwinia sp. BNK-24-b]|uniref:hypothetical protein n=1 Tax=Erwinia TaxID=551 RepID=UPI001FEEF63B|nr:hypothetical protein [Erwinia phyllosphaerae]MBV4367927.1 hypothetical protein [Erwinia phyllosphaerae]